VLAARSLHNGLQARSGRCLSDGTRSPACPQEASCRRHRDLIIALAARHKLPAVYPNDLFIRSGGLISYGADTVDQFGRAAGYVDRILRGEKPADLPVQAPTKYELVVNLKAAKAIGLTISPSVLARADEVIE
jgi:putative tryptophan/tyrosine transport system substrate-binding protein